MSWETPELSELRAGSLSLASKLRGQDPEVLCVESTVSCGEPMQRGDKQTTECTIAKHQNSFCWLSFWLHCTTPAVWNTVNVDILNSCSDGWLVTIVWRGTSPNLVRFWSTIASVCHSQRCDLSIFWTLSLALTLSLIPGLFGLHNAPLG